MSDPRKTTVSIVRLDTYEPEKVDKALTDLLAPLGNMARFVGAGSTPVIKPNFLTPTPPEKAVCTHPEVIRATARLVRSLGGRDVVVTDSPGIGTALKCAAKLGMDGPEEPFRVEDVDEGTAPPTGSKYQRLFLSKKMLSASPLINIAKAKTHGQMVITAAAKNTFGGVIGFEKAQWHYRAGRDPMDFARLIVDIHEMLGPQLSILDGVVGMEGNGPGSGDPRPLGILMASTNAHLLDNVLCRIWGIDPMEVFTQRAAREKGLLETDGVLEIVGPPLDSFTISPPWRRARPSLVRQMIGPKWLIPVVDRFMSLRPVVDQTACTACGRCIEACAAKAMKLAPTGEGVGMGIEIDKKKCISCFCCQEMCPHGAIEVQPGPLARFMGLGRRD